MKTNAKLGLVLLLIGAGSGGLIAATQENASTSAPEAGVVLAHNELPRHELKAKIGRLSPDARHEVTEVFMYTCPHCHKMSPTITAWADGLEDDVAFESMPIVFRDKDEDYIRLHYGLLALGLDLDVIQEGIFNAVHNDGFRPRARKDFVALGIKISRRMDSAIEKSMDSFAVSAKVKRSKATFAKSGAMGVPAFIIDGEYRLDPNDARTMDDITGSLTTAVQ